MAGLQRYAYAGAPVVTTTTGAITGSPGTFSITSATGWPTGNPFVAAVYDPADRANTIEKIKVTRSGTTLTVVTRGVDGYASQDHASGERCEVVISALELDDMNLVASTLQAQGSLLAHTGTAHAAVTPAANGRVPRADSGVANGLAFAQVDSAGLANDSVTAAKIVNGSVATATINANAVTPAKYLPDEIRLTGYNDATASGPVTWDTEVADPAGYVTVPTGTITIPSGKGGLFLISVATGSARSGSCLNCSWTVVLGGQTRKFRWVNTPGSAGRPTWRILRRLNAGDTITMEAATDDGASAASMNLTLTMLRIAN